jgi:hypothetical protein
VLCTWSTISVAVGAASGLASLAGFSKGTSRIVLALVALGCGLVAVVRFSNHFLVRRNRDLKTRVGEYQRIVEAVQSVVDRERSAYREQLTLTVIVGNIDTEDQVVEQRRTEPTEPITYRVMQPLIPVGRSVPPTSLAELNYTVHFIDGDDNDVEQFTLTDETKPLRIWLVFKRAIVSMVDWEVKYRPAGLLRPLRETGQDRLRWRDRFLGGTVVTPPSEEMPSVSVLSAFTVEFVFPGVKKRPRVVESNDRGTVSDAVREAGRWVVLWTDPEPLGHVYEWELFQEP